MKKGIFSKIRRGLVFTSVCAVALYVFANARSMHENMLVSSVGMGVVKLLDPANHDSGGTGFPIKAPSGLTYTLTNKHVCELNKNGKMHAAIPGTTRFYVLNIVAVASNTDLCLLEGMPGHKGLSLAKSLEVNEEIAVIGHPALMPTSLSRGRVTDFDTIRILIATNVPKDRCLAAGYEFESLEGTQEEAFFGIKSACLMKIKSTVTSALVFPGSSGSPAVNFWGNLVGVVFAANSLTNYGFLVELESVREFLSIY